MSSMPLSRRFLASSRGRILTLLRRGSRTVDELAQVLGLTDNAVRAQLATLERDGLVEHAGVRRTGEGAGKPAYLYSLTSQAEGLFPKAFELVLRGLLDVLLTDMDPVRFEAHLRSVGRNIAEQQKATLGATGDLRGRLNQVAILLTDLGGLVELEESDATYRICGYICPLSNMSASYPQLCQLMQTLIAELVGTSVQQRCERSDAPGCRFEVARQVNQIGTR